MSEPRTLHFEREDGSQAVMPVALLEQMPSITALRVYLTAAHTYGGATCDELFGGGIDPEGISEAIAALMVQDLLLCIFDDQGAVYLARGVEVAR